MTVTRANATSAAIMALVSSVLSFLVLTGIIHWDDDGKTLAAANFIVSNLVIVGGLIFASTPASNT